MVQEIKITANSDIEALIEKIGTNEVNIKGKGYINPQTGVVGLMIFPEDSPHEMIDIFFESQTLINQRQLQG
jgi:hypothetical protein